MSIVKHVRIEELLRFRDGTLTAEELAAVDAHLATCPSCATLAREMFRDDAAASLESAFDFAEPQTGAGAAAPRLWLIAAAVLVAAILGVIVLEVTQRAPAPQSPPSARLAPASQPSRAAALVPPWNDVVAEALREGRIPAPPELARLRGTTGTLRGRTDADQSTLQPAGVFVAGQRPPLSWRTTSPGPYVVSVFSDEREVARSPRVDDREWTPPPLARGRTYQWQVALPNQDVIPAPPAPPASFHVIDDASWNAIETARRTTPGDHLTLGVLSARAGLQSDAERELGTFAAEHPEDAAAKRLLESVRAW